VRARRQAAACRAGCAEENIFRAPRSAGTSRFETRLARECDALPASLRRPQQHSRRAFRTFAAAFIAATSLSTPTGSPPSRRTIKCLFSVRQIPQMFVRAARDVIKPPFILAMMSFLLMPRDAQRFFPFYAKPRACQRHAGMPATARVSNHDTNNDKQRPPRRREIR